MAIGYGAFPGAICINGCASTLNSSSLSRIGSTPPSINSTIPPPPFQFTIYRGTTIDNNGHQIPFASAAPYDNYGFTIGKVSLFMNGEFGVYQNYLRRWHEMQRFGKQISVSLNITLAQLLSFSFKDKIRIDNMDYFVQSMKVRFSKQGLLPVSAELISII